MTTFTLYRFFDSEGCLLYVGMTVNPGRRMERHSGTKVWWLEVAEIRMEQHLTLDALRTAEREAIIAERPKYNIRMNGGTVARPHPVVGGKLIETPDDGLVGKWFHSYVIPDPDDDRQHATIDSRGYIREWQGQVTGREAAVLICQLYSWLDGEPTNQVLVELDDMLIWRFFDTNEDMLCADGCPENSEPGRDRPCGRPVTHVIRRGPFGPTYRCHRCIRYYSGVVEEL